MMEKETFNLLARLIVSIITAETNPKEFNREAKAHFTRRGKIYGPLTEIECFGEGVRLTRRVGKKRVSISIKIAGG